MSWCAAVNPCGHTDADACRQPTWRVHGGTRSRDVKLLHMHGTRAELMRSPLD
jgi:hypothetical protein